MGKIGVHKDIVNLPIHFENERVLNIFVGLFKEYNKKLNADMITLTFKELWELAGYKNRPEKKEIQELANILSQPICYKVREGTTFKGETINGSVFIIAVNHDTETVRIEIPQLFKPHIFLNMDVKILDKNKKKEKLTVQELDYWDTVLKDKKKEIVLLEEAEVLGLKGKYAKRLYMILKQYAGTSGKLYMAVEQFKDVMEVPETYSYAELNRTIINRAKAELEKKGIFKFIDEPKGKGRRKIEKIDITFVSTKFGTGKTKTTPDSYKNGSQKDIYEEIEDRSGIIEENSERGLKNVRELMKKFKV